MIARCGGSTKGDAFTEDKCRKRLKSRDDQKLMWCEISAVNSMHIGVRQSTVGFGVRASGR